MKLFVTCEHAGNRIPEKFEPLFKGAHEVLESHRGYDPGAYDLFCALQKTAHFEKANEISRLLVELNRSLRNPQLFSEFTRSLTASEKASLLEDYYHPYRNEVESTIEKMILKEEKVLHLSIHTFTPELNGKKRNADIGLLYDPARVDEKLYSKKIKRLLLEEGNKWNIRFNYPYLGRADGFTTFLRKRFPANYSGIEIEVNQSFVMNNMMDPSVKMQLLKAVSLLKNNRQE